jgi:formylglycine-generating enzyme required for sulfatase activity
VKAFERTHRLSDGYADSLYYVAFCHFKQGLYRQAMSRLIQYRLDKMMKGKKKAEKLSDSMQLILEIEKLLEIQRLPNQVPGNYSGMVQVPGGQMYYGWDGTDDSKTAAIQMRVAPFAIDTMEVSNAEYEVFVKACDWRSPQGKGTALEEASLAWTESVPEEIASLPVVFVSWEDATAYAAWCGKRLPSELEWEFAARGGLVGTAYPWKSRPNGKQAQFGDTERPRAVTEGEVNGYGMLNIVGNAAEWCLDVFDDDLRTSLELRSKEASKNAPRAYRGGHWRSGPEDITVTVRRGLPPGTRNEFIGFRCATDITESK